MELGAVLETVGPIYIYIFIFIIINQKSQSKQTLRRRNAKAFITRLHTFPNYIHKAIGRTQAKGTIRKGEKCP